MTCTYEGKSYSDGVLICMNGREMKCRGGEWSETGYACATNTVVHQDRSSAQSDELPDIEAGAASKSPD